MWLADDRNMPLMCMKIVLPDDTPLSHWATRPRCPGGQKAVVGIVNLPLQEGDREQTERRCPKGLTPKRGTEEQGATMGLEDSVLNPLSICLFWVCDGQGRRERIIPQRT